MISFCLCGHEYGCIVYKNVLFFCCDDERNWEKNDERTICELDT